MRGLLLTATVLLLTACIPAPTAMPTAMPTLSATMTAIATRTATVTVTLQPTASSTATPTAHPTYCPPALTPIATPIPTRTPYSQADLIAHCFLDMNNDAIRTWDELGIQCTLLLGNTCLQPPTYYSLTVGVAGVGIMFLPPAAYTVQLYSFEAWYGVWPDFRIPAGIELITGANDILFIPFNGPLPPTPTRTPTP